MMRSEDVVMVGSKRLSRAAYEKNLEASRRWKREHPDEANAHNWRTCACGRRMDHAAQTCRPCFLEATRLREAMILELRAKGLTNVEIARRMGLTRWNVGNTIHRMRRAGIDVPPSPFFRKGQL